MEMKIKFTDNVEVVVGGKLEYDSDGTPVFTVMDRNYNGGDVSLCYRYSTANRHHSQNKIPDDVMREIGRLLHLGYDVSYIAKECERSYACINNIKRCRSPRYQQLFSEVGGWLI